MSKSLTRYERNPKKALGNYGASEAWWYGDHKGIDIFIQTPTGPVTARIKRHALVNGPEYHTGKKCVEGCGRAAGTLWSPYWCHPCNVERMKRIGACLEAEAARYAELTYPEERLKP